MCMTAWSHISQRLQIHVCLHGILGHVATIFEQVMLEAW